MAEGQEDWVQIGTYKKKLELTVNEPVTFSWTSVSPSVKDHDAGRDWGQEEKGTTEGKVAGWHHQLDGHEFG